MMEKAMIVMNGRQTLSIINFLSQLFFWSESSCMSSRA